MWKKKSQFSKFMVFIILDENPLLYIRVQRTFFANLRQYIFVQRTIANIFVVKKTNELKG